MVNFDTVFRDLITDVISTNPSVLTMKQDVETLKVDVRVLKEDVRGLKEDVRVLKEDVRGLKEDVRGLKESVFHLGVGQEEMRHDLKLILEAVVPAQKRAERLEHVEAKVERHDVRLTAVEVALKDSKSAKGDLSR